MANVWQKKLNKSGYWQAQFRDERGVRVNRSTKQTDKRKAQKVADEWEEAAIKARHGELTQEAGIKTVGRMMKATGAGKLEVPSIKVAFERWIADREERKRSLASINRYKSVLKSLFLFLGADRLKASISSLHTTELDAWHSAEMKAGKSGTTADLGINIVRGALNKMVNKHKFIESNPARGVESSEEGSETREVFTDDEVTSLLTVCDDEWKGMILCSAWHSIRLHDCASLTWSNIDLKSGSLSYVPSKTRKKNPEPIVRYMPVETVTYLNTLTQGIGKVPLFPRLYGRTSGSHAGLSNEFNRLMKTAGIVVPMGQAKTGKGRRFRKKGFHSFRHYSISRMAETNIPEAQRRLLAGHSATSKEHGRYIHGSEKSQRAALATLSSLTGRGTENEVEKK
jgi:integrase